MKQKKELKNGGAQIRTALYKAAVQTMWFVFFLLVSFFIFYKVIVTREYSLFTGWDNAIQSVAWYNKIWNAVHAGDLPLWDFNVLSGVSFIGEFQPGAVYPINLLFCLVVPEITSYTLDVLVVIHFALGAYFMFCYLRDYQFTYFASVFGAITFAFAGAVSGRAYGQSNIFMGIVWMPLVMLFLKRTYGQVGAPSKKVIYACLTGITLGLSILAGHLQPYIHIVVCMAVFTIFSANRWGGFLEKVGILFGIGVISIAFTFGQVIGGVEYLSNSYRWVSLENPVKGLAAIPRAAYDLVLLRYQQLPSLVDSSVVGEDGTTLFIGIFALLLAVSIFFFKKKKEDYCHLTMVIVGVLIAMGSQTMVGLLLYRAPGLSTVREPARSLMIYDFGMAFLAGKAFNNLLGRLKSSEQHERIKKWTYIIVSVVLCCESIYAATCFNGSHMQPRNTGYAPDVSYQHTGAIQYLEDTNQLGIYRFANINNDAVLPNISDKYTEIQTTRGHRATMPINYFDYLCRDWNETSESYSFLGVKYLVSKEPLEKEDVVQVYSGDGVYIYENPDENISIFHINDDTGIYAANVQSTDWATNYVTINVDMAADGQFIFSQVSFPGWNVYVDGEERPLESYDIFQAVSVEQGTHTICFRYEPWWLAGWGISLGACVIFIIYTLLKIRKGRNV